MNRRRILQVAVAGFAAATSFSCSNSTGDNGVAVGPAGGSGNSDSQGNGGASNAPMRTTSEDIGSGGTESDRTTPSGNGGSRAEPKGSGGTNAPTNASGGSKAGPNGSGGSSAGPKGSGGNADSTAPKASGGVIVATGRGGAGTATEAATGGVRTRTTSSGGRGGASSGAAGSSGSKAPDQSPPTDPVPSEGCGKTSAPQPCDKSGSPCTMDVSGTQRKFYVQLPSNYDASHPYPVVFQFHPLGGNAEQGMTMYGIRQKFPDAIYATPDGLKSGSYQGFPNTNGSDEALTRAIIADIEAKYCIDKARYFSTGFSYGGSMSYTAACNMSDVFRAIGAMSGAPISGATCSTKQPARPVAFWGTHGTDDTALPMDMALPIRDAFVKRNGCGSTTKPVEPSPCVAYDGCESGYPVVWCQVEGGPHGIPTWSAAAIAKFFQQF